MAATVQIATYLEASIWEDFFRYSESVRLDAGTLGRLLIFRFINSPWPLSIEDGNHRTEKLTVHIKNTDKDAFLALLNTSSATGSSALRALCQHELKEGWLYRQLTQIES